MGRSRTPSWEPQKITSDRNQDGIWEARTRYRDGSGKVVQIRRNGRTKGAAETKVKRAISEAREKWEENATRAVAVPAAQTLGDVAMAWLETRKPGPVVLDLQTQDGKTTTQGLTMQSWLKYEQSLRDHVLPALASVPISDLGTPECERTIHGVYDKATGSGYRAAAMAKQALQQVMDFAVRQGHRPDNPVRSVSRIPKRRTKPKALDSKGVEDVYRAAAPRLAEPGIGGPKPTSRLADIVLLLAATGVRIGEALGTRWEDIDLSVQGPTLTVSGTLVEQAGYFFRQSYPKSESSERTVQLPDWAIVMLLRRRANTPPSATGAVFPTRNGTFMRPSNFRKNLRDALRAAGIQERVTAHTFRKTVATALAAAAGDEAAAAQLGHASPDVTRTYYIRRPDLVPNYTEALAPLAPRSS